MTSAGAAEPGDPTGFPDLNNVLEKLVAGTRSAPGENLRGVYLQGSFAVGDADILSRSAGPLAPCPSRDRPQAVAATVAFVDYVTRQGAREAARSTRAEHP